MGNGPLNLPEKEVCEPLQKEVTEFWSGCARGYGLFTRIILKNSSQVASELERCIPGGRRLKVLDAGTGAGFVAILLAKAGHEAVGLDVSESMLEEARWNAAQSGLDIEFVRGDAASTGFQDGCFDAVVARNLVFTLPNPGMAYREWIRILRPGGRVVVMDGSYYFQTKKEEYAKRDRYMRLKYGAEEIAFRAEMGNVDYARLGEIAMKLYPNRVRRPSWDLWMMTYSGMNDVSFRCTDPEDYNTYTEDGPARIPVRYTMCARKPFSGNILDEGSSLTPAVESEAAPQSLEAIANPFRYRILRLLMRGPMNNSALCEATGLRENLLTYHTSILRGSGVIVSAKNGRSTFYSIADREALEAIINAAELICPEERRPGRKNAGAAPQADSQDPGIAEDSVRCLFRKGDGRRSTY